MPRSSPRQLPGQADLPRRRRAWLAGGAIVATTGLAMVGASYFAAPLAQSTYTAEDAARYQELSAKVHTLSGKESLAPLPPAESHELADTRAEYLDMRQKLDSARARGPWLAKWLRYAGAGLALAGLAVVEANRRQNG